MAISAMSTGRRSFPLEEGHLPTIKLSREVLFFLRTLEGLDGVLFAAEMREGESRASSSRRQCFERRGSTSIPTGCPFFSCVSYRPRTSGVNAAVDAEESSRAGDARTLSLRVDFVLACIFASFPTSPVPSKTLVRGDLPSSSSALTIEAFNSCRAPATSILMALCARCPGSLPISVWASDRVFEALAFLTGRFATRSVTAWYKSIDNRSRSVSMSPAVLSAASS